MGRMNIQFWHRVSNFWSSEKCETRLYKMPHFDMLYFLTEIFKTDKSSFSILIKVWNIVTELEIQNFRLPRNNKYF